VIENLPQTWVAPALQEIAQINPTLDKSIFKDDLEVSFVPMPAVEAETGRIDVSQTKKFGGVKKGYTPFQRGDVLFAKITPCMENGKMAIVPDLHNSIGFGSTEFHVLRAFEGIEPKFLYYFVSSKSFRYDAEHNMTGAVGQKRVPTTYIVKSIFTLPPTNEQKRIVAKIEELFSELDKGIESLKTAREQLKVYRQAVLKYAFEGKLTASWRQKHKDKLATAEQLLESIKQERENSYQQQLNEWNVAVKAGEKLAKPRAPQPISNLMPSELQKLPSLPDGWIWLRYGDLCSVVRNGISQKPEGNEGTKIFRISAVRPMEFITHDVRYIDNSSGQYDEYFLHKGDLVFTRYNGSRSFVGVCAEYKGDGTHLFPDKLIQTRIAIPSIISGYLEKAVNCGAPRKFIERLIRTTAGQSGISGADIKAMPVPICSKAEQSVINDYLNEELSRISEMVDEIETNLQKSEALRQSILKKAFSGKLVAQDPNDEPASVLLERIRAEKEAQETESKKSKTKRKAA